jgi:predicted MFS family arabinose efflux permease
MLTQRQVLIVTLCALTIVTLSMGVRQSFGLFTRPISMDLGLGRQVFSMAIAIQTLITGFGNPIAGALADKFGTRRVALVGGVLYIAGLALGALSEEPMHLQLTFGVLMGMALSAVSMGVIFGAVARVVPPEKRTSAFGIVTAGGSIGQFLMIPTTSALMSAFGWRESLMLLTVAALAMMVVSLPLKLSDDAPARASKNEANSLGQALGEARSHRGYWLLTASFFVCGFHVSFVSTHFPAYLADRGMAPDVIATAFALIGLCNIFGSYLSGVLSGKVRKRYVLAFIYSGRAVLFVPLLLLPMTPTLAMIFSAGMGFLYLGTVPPTSGIVAQIFGVRFMGTLMGIVLLSHQIGGFLGAWLAGYLYDTTGSYEVVWMINIALGIIAAALIAPAGDKPIDRSAPAQAGG